MKDESLGFLVSDISRLMRQQFQRRIAGSPLTLAQARALVRISRNEGIRQVDLAELLEIQPITLVRLIDQLAEAGLVERRPDPADRRAYRLFLTGHAGAQLKLIRTVSAGTQAQALRGMKAAEASALFSALQTVRANLATSE
ncbi:MAG TPA: MarR family transcriptional regulator [Rhodocyclaceae bacterium]